MMKIQIEDNPNQKKKEKAKKKNNKKIVRARAHVLPFYLASAIIFGTDIAGQSILPPDKSFWTIIGILMASFIIYFPHLPCIKRQFMIFGLKIILLEVLEAFEGIVERIF